MSRSIDVSRRKQLIIAEGLTSSVGIFFAKFIGLFYAVPYSSMLRTADDLAYYGVAFNICSYLLDICTTDSPFTIATLIAEYSTRGDYQTLPLIKKLPASLTTCFDSGMMIIVVPFSSPLAVLVMSDEGGNVKMMQVVLTLISFVLFFAPLLSSIRGSYQGFKRMEICALSQVLEQVVRVAFLLSASVIAVYALHTDQVWALYFDMIFTSISAILAIMYLKLYDKKQMRELKRLARIQKVARNNDRRETLRELVFIAFPYLIVAILGYSGTIVNMLFLNKGFEAHGNTDAEILLISGSINYDVLKLMSIPMILAPGSSPVITSHITTALINRDLKLVRKNIRDCVDIVLYISPPISFCLFVYTKPLRAILPPPADSENLELLADTSNWSFTEAFLNTIGSILTTLLTAVGLRGLNIRNLAIMMVVKFSAVYPLLKYFDHQGVVMSSILAMGIFIILDTYALTSYCEIRWKYAPHKPLVTLLVTAALFAVVRGCDLIGLESHGSGRMLSLLQPAVNGSLVMLAYFDIICFFSTPQTIPHFDPSCLLKRGRRRQAHATG